MAVVCQMGLVGCIQGLFGYEQGTQQSMGESLNSLHEGEASVQC